MSLVGANFNLINHSVQIIDAVNGCWSGYLDSGRPLEEFFCNRGEKLPQFISYEPIVSVDGWDRAEEVPTGSRVKMTVIHPTTGKYHIFKYPKERREHQIWSELIASYIAGDLLGWDVQLTAIAQKDGRVGNLLEYIYEPGSDSAAQELFTEGWSLCTQVDPD